MEYVLNSEFRIYFIMDFITGGELFKHLQDVKRFDDDTVNSDAQLQSSLETRSDVDLSYIRFIEMDGNTMSLGRAIEVGSGAEPASTHPTQPGVESRPAQYAGRVDEIHVWYRPARDARHQRRSGGD